MPTASDPSRVPLDLTLTRPGGGSLTLGEALTDPLTVVQLVRYFGCLPCQEWLVGLDRRRPDLADMGVGVLAVGGSADYQAVWLQEERGISVPLLLDPEHALRRHLSADRALGWRLADPRGLGAYARSLAHGFRPQAITRDTVRSPGVAVLDREGRVRWRHVGRRIGDYPEVDEVVAALSRLA